MLTSVPQKNAQKFYCSICDFGCSKLSEWKRHIITRKHQNVDNIDKMLTKKRQKTPKQFRCDCGKEYSHRQSLSLHRKTCLLNIENKNVDNSNKINIESDDKNLILSLLNQNNQLQNQIVDLCKDKCNTSIYNANINSNNKTFNLNVFLNEQCKDAMNIMDFVKSLKNTPEDIDRVGRLGYAEAISKLMIEGLNELDVTQRPIHCTDAKREKMYVRHDNEWKKDIESTGKLKKAIKVVGQQNLTTLDEWKDKHPQHNQPTSKHHLDYLEICNRTMTGMLDDDDKEFNKIMKTLAPATRIDKVVNDVNKNN